MLKFSANISMLFTEVPFMQRFSAAAAQGFAAVEFWFAYEFDPHEIAALLAQHQLTCTVLNAAPGQRLGDFGLAIDAQRQTEFEASIVQALEYARVLRCPLVHVLAGLLPPEHHWTTGYQAQYVRNLRWAGERAALQGTTVVIEALNAIDRPGYFVPTIERALELLAQIDHPQVRLMFDAYHVHKAGAEILPALNLAVPAIAHIQIADSPGRHEPCTGTIDFESVFSQLRRLIATGQYSGWVGCEYQPMISTVQSLGWMKQRI